MIRIHLILAVYLLLTSGSAIQARRKELLVLVGFRYPVMLRQELLKQRQILWLEFTLPSTGQVYSAVEYNSAKADILECVRWTATLKVNQFFILFLVSIFALVFCMCCLKSSWSNNRRKINALIHCRHIRLKGIKVIPDNQKKFETEKPM